MMLHGGSGNKHMLELGINNQIYFTVENIIILIFSGLEVGVTWTALSYYILD